MVPSTGYINVLADGAYITDSSDMDTDRDAYIEVRASGELESFVLEKASIGEYYSPGGTNNYFTNVYVEGYADGALVAKTAPYSSEDQGAACEAEYSVDYSGFAGKQIDSFKIYYTAMAGTSHVSFNFSYFTISGAAEKDMTPPTVTIESTESSVTNADTIPVTIHFSESVTGLDTAGIAVTNATISDFSGTGDNYTAKLTPVTDGTVEVYIKADAAQDAAGNGNDASATLKITSDRTAPSASVTSTYSGSTSVEALPIEISFSEAVTGLGLTEIIAANATISDLSGSDNTYTAKLTPDADGTVEVYIKADAVQDAAGNGNDASDTFKITSDRTAPLLSDYSITGISYTSASVNAAIASEEGTIYYILVPDNSVAPTSQETKSGLTYSGVTVISHGSKIADIPSHSYSFLLTGLTEGTAYDIYLVAEDDEAIFKYYEYSC